MNKNSNIARNNSDLINIIAIINFVSTKKKWGAKALISAVETMKQSSIATESISRQDVITVLQQKPNWGKNELSKALSLVPIAPAPVVEPIDKVSSLITKAAHYIKTGKCYINNEYIVVYGLSTKKFEYRAKAKGYDLKLKLISLTEEEIADYLTKFCKAI